MPAMTDDDLKDLALQQMLDDNGTEMTVGAPQILTRNGQPEAAPAIGGSGVPTQTQTGPTAAERFQKDFSERFSEANRQKAAERAEATRVPLALLEGLSGIGGALSRRGPDVGAEHFAGVRKRIQDGTIGDFERQKADALESFQRDNVLGSQAAKEREAAAEGEASSPQSQASRDYLSKIFSGKDFSGMSATQMRPFLQFAEKVYGQSRDASSDSYRKEKDERDFNLRERELKNARADRNTERNAARTFQAEQKDLDRAAQIQAAKIAASQKQTESDATQRIPGFERTENAPKLSAGEAEKARETVNQVRNLQGIMKRLDDLYKQGGPSPVGERAQQMEALANAASLKLKEVENLGVLSGPDLSILQTQIKNPTTWGQFGAGLIGQDSAGTTNKEFGKSIDRTLKTKMETLGYRPQVQTRTLKDGTMVQVRQLPDGSFEEL